MNYDLINELGERNMKKKSGLLYKTLVIGIIILFLGVTINPAVAEEDKLQKTEKLLNLLNNSHRVW